MGADTEVINVEVLSSGHNNVEGPDENVGEKSKSNTEQTEEGKLEKENNNTKTEEATSMEADKEAIGIEAQSGLLNHVVGFHAKGAVASKSMEEETNKVVNSNSMCENTTNMENSKVKGGTVDGDKEQTVGVEKPMKDEWKFDDLEEDDTMAVSLSISCCIVALAAVSLLIFLSSIPQIIDSALENRKSTGLL